MHGAPGQKPCMANLSSEITVGPAALSPLTQAPPHVPEALIFDFDYFNAPELAHEPHRNALILHDKAPPIFWSRRNGGHWIVTRAAPALAMLQRPDLFPSDPRYNPGARTPRTLPNLSDPPEHTEYRRILNKWFAPGAMAAMEPEIRALAIELIEELRPRGESEFLRDIAKQFPIVIFLRLVGAPLEDREMLCVWAERAVRAPERAERDAVGRDMLAYVRKLFDERRRNPGPDLLSRLLAATIDGRSLTQAELDGIGLLLFLGGLDTVASVLTFTMAYLATHPADYARLVADRGLIGRALEELLRVHGVGTIERGVKEEVTFEGVDFKPGERVSFMLGLYGMDIPEIDDPLTVDLDREISRHLIFGAGPHRCLGSHLARVEIRVFLEEWCARIPHFGIAPGKQVRTMGGIVWSPVDMPLVWPQ